MFRIESALPSGEAYSSDAIEPFCYELVLDIRVAVVEDGERLFDRPPHGSLAVESCVQDIEGSI